MIHGLIFFNLNKKGVLVALIKCTECNHQISSDALICPNCGTSKTPGKKKREIVIGIVGCIFMFFFAIFFSMFLDSLK